MRGNKGELAAVPLSDYPERAKRVFLNQIAFEVENVWRHKHELIFKFAGVNSISAAEPLVGLNVEIPIEERVSLPEGEYYQSDLVGCRVFDAGSGRLIGVVEGWQEYGGPPLMELKTEDNREVLVPFAKSICAEIDVASKKIVVNLPEGLDEL